MQIEVWKDIPNWETKYQASDWGRIKSLARLDNRGHSLKERILKDNVKHFYKGLALFRNGKPYHYTTHVLIALTFLGPRIADMQINHKDGNKFNNRADNLEYVTAIENIQHRIQVLGIDIRQLGEKHPGAKLTESDVLAIRKAWANGTSQRGLARQYGVNQTNIFDIVHRNNWTHI